MIAATQVRRLMTSVIEGGWQLVADSHQQRVERESAHLLLDIERNPVLTLESSND